MDLQDELKKVGQSKKLIGIVFIRRNSRTRTGTITAAFSEMSAAVS